MPYSSKTPAQSTEATLKIPFDSEKHAEIAYRVLSVDKEPERNFVGKNLTLHDNQLQVHFVAKDPKSLRTAITSFFESLFLCTDTIKQFSSDENAGAHASTEST